MRTILLTAATAASLALGAGADAARAAEPDATTSDVRCLIAMAALSQSPDEDAKRAGGLGLIYFWGRLEGRGATEHVDVQLADQALKMTPDDIKTLAPACGATLTAATQAIQAAGQKLGERMQQNAPPPAAGGGAAQPPPQHN